ncbi:GGDEF domain-containing protein [Sphingomonas sp. ID0503]|uniref:GGDEF domain-containing protein n=1 Tax=Sphingomonas sp. ID0503 TaxID=3399691 RepID=UPI003AFAA5BA
MAILKKILQVLGKARRLATARRERARNEESENIDYRRLAENSPDVIFRINARNFPDYVSPSVQGMLGWSATEMMAIGPRTIHSDDEPMVRAINDRLISGELREATVQCRMVHRDGHDVWIEANARLSDGGDGAAAGVVMVMRDVSERKRLEDELRTLAATDGLTGLLNRRAFDEELEREWHRTVRDSAQMSLLMIDVDHFKSFNDLYGHQAGDECLKVVAAAVKNCARRPGDSAARYGGEELAVILPGTDSSGASDVAEAIRMQVEALGVDHAMGIGDAMRVTVSIGVGTAFARSGASVQMPAGLVQAADTALYKAKDLGRNRVVAAIVLTAPS